MLFRKSPITVRIIGITNTLCQQNAKIFKFEPMVSIVTTALLSVAHSILNDQRLSVSLKNLDL
jgi:hypothetical protein